jgi:hypothetical protein
MTELPATSIQPRRVGHLFEFDGFILQARRARSASATIYNL